MTTGKNSIVAMLASLLLITACGDEQKPTEATTTPPKPADTIGISRTENAYISWEEFYHNNDVSFSLDSFIKYDTVKGELLTVYFTPTDSFYRLFGNVLVFNQDSSKYIDAYSTGWISDQGKDGKVHMREGEPDQEVAVIDLKNNTRTRVLYCGPGCLLQKVFWYNENVVGIIGLINDADEYYTPTIWFVNIHNGLTIPYHNNSSVSILVANDFLKRHLEAKGIVVE